MAGCGLSCLPACRTRKLIFGISVYGDRPSTEARFRLSLQPAGGKISKTQVAADPVRRYSREATFSLSRISRGNVLALQDILSKSCRETDVGDRQFRVLQQAARLSDAHLAKVVTEASTRDSQDKKIGLNDRGCIHMDVLGGVLERQILLQVAAAAGPRRVSQMGWESELAEWRNGRESDRLANGGNGRDSGHATPPGKARCSPKRILSARRSCLSGPFVNVAPALPADRADDGSTLVGRQE